MAEIELKFELPAGFHRRLGQARALAGARPATRKLHAIYFDTPGFALRRREMALRLRREGRHWVQALKAGRSGAGGLHAREEWEVRRPGASLDPAIFEQLPALDGTLQEVFRVEMRRTAWRLAPAPGDVVEVALDRGAVARLGRRDPVSEVEIESVSGDPRAIFAVAEALLEEVPLRPSALTKAQRGYRLAGADAAGPSKSRAVVLEPGMSPAAAARATLGAALEQLQANDTGVLEGRDPEYLHQLRVALRRMRSALRVYRGAVDPAFAAHAREELRWLAQLTGPARDWDVLAQATLPALLAAYGAGPGARAVPARVAARRAAALATLHEALRSPRYARLVLDIARWLWEGAGEGAEGEDLVAFAARVVRKRHRRLLEGARRLSILTPAERHELRLEAKRLRYAAEGFASLFRRRRVEAYIETLSDIQEDLGRANDTAVAARLLGELRLPAPFAQFARGWLAAGTQASVQDLGRHGERLAAAKPFWER